MKKVEKQKEEVEMEAREATRRREEGGGGDDLERRGRWLKGVEWGMREILEV